MKQLFTLTLAALLLLSSFQRVGLRAAEESQKKPFVVEYYYKVEWGHFDEFMELFKRNHYPILKELKAQGVILEMTAAYPRYHSAEESRWDFRFTIVFKDAETAHADGDWDAMNEALHPDMETFRKEEQHRFEILLEHTDVPITEEDPSSW